MRHFQYFLEGRKFTAFTDHKPLIHTINKATDAWCKRQRRHLAGISEFTTDIRHISGADNPVADALSRPSIHATQLGIDFVAIAHLQDSDEEIHALRTATTALKLADVLVHADQTTLLCDISQQNPRPYVPKTMRREVFSSVHNLSHPGINSTSKLVAECFV